MKIIPVYGLAIESGSAGNVQLAAPRSDQDMPIFFTKKLSKYMFEFAEKHINCQAGDRVYLIAANVDVHAISHSQDFVSHFKTLLNRSDGLKDITILQQRTADGIDSPALSRRVLLDIERFCAGGPQLAVA